MKGLSSGISLTPNASKVLEKRYLKKNEVGKVVETPEELFRRVARTVAAADLMYGKSEAEVVLTEEDFYEMECSVCPGPGSCAMMRGGPLRRASLTWAPGR